MSIATEISRLQTAKTNLKTSIENKGVDIPAATKLDGYSAFVDAIQTGGTPVLQSKTVSPTESTQTVTADTGYSGLSSVQVNAISPTYVGTGVTRKSAATITPGTTNQTIASGTYLTGTQTIAGDADLVASNIKSGVNIFGVTGAYSGGGGGTSLETVSVTIDMSVLVGGGFGFLITGTQLDGGGLTYSVNQLDDSQETITFDAVVGTNVTIASFGESGWYWHSDEGKIENTDNTTDSCQVVCVRGADTIHIDV